MPKNQNVMNQSYWVQAFLKAARVRSIIDDHQVAQLYVWFLEGDTPDQAVIKWREKFK